MITASYESAFDHDTLFYAGEGRQFYD